MKVRHASLILSIAVATVAPFAVLAGGTSSAAEFFARGQSLLRSGDFAGALADFAAAARSEPDNETFRQEHALLRRIVDLRESMATLDDGKKWQAAALALRSYYVDHALLEEVLLIDQQAHARLANAESAARLADTQIKLGRDDDAVRTLSGLTAKDQTLQTRVLLGIAFAHTGRIVEARSLADGVPVADAGPGLLYDLARLHALLKNHTVAIGLLTRCFESTRPSRLAAFKDYAKSDKDLSGIAALPEFASALATASKVKESDCSSGTSCGKCPSRDKCAGKSDTKPKSGTGKP